MGQLAIVIAIFGQIWLFDHKRGHWKTDAPQSVVDVAVDKTLNEEDEDILDELRFQRKLLDGSALF